MEDLKALALFLELKSTITAIAVKKYSIIRRMWNMGQWDMDDLMSEAKIVLLQKGLSGDLPKGYYIVAINNRFKNIIRTGVREQQHVKKGLNKGRDWINNG